MGRRSVHSPEELRLRILDASQAIIERDGLVGLSAREIARLIGYSPGTLYNIFESLDHVLLTLQVQLVGSSIEAMKSAPRHSDPHKRLEALSAAYVDFALDNKKMWAVLFTHSLPADVAAPAALHDQLNEGAAIICDALMPLMASASPTEVDVAARTFWAGLNGITAVAVTEKGLKITPATAQTYVKQLTSIYSRGLAKA